MSDKLPSKTAKEIIKIIENKGFVKVRQSGSHAILEIMTTEELPFLFIQINPWEKDCYAK